ncbi:MAG: hypothetical protein HY917_02210 [Candidatus Diapherotrites archaeon]|nr:hypothetical protein [Candidatus Diapherotrites archaeon]
MNEKVAVLVPPYGFSMEESQKRTFKEARLLHRVAEECRKKGYRIITIPHIPEKKPALEKRINAVLEEFKRINWKGKQVLLIGHSLGAVLLKANMVPLRAIIGSPFKLISIAGQNGGKMPVEPEEKKATLVQQIWKPEIKSLKTHSVNYKIPLDCQVIEVYSGKDPIREGIRRTRTKTVRISIKHSRPDTERFDTHHLFSGHEKEAIRGIRRHLQ